MAEQHERRRSPGRPALPLDRIVKTALAIVDECGAEALSMRTLAQRLDSGTATLYRHFSGRAEVVAHVIDRVFGMAELDLVALGAMPWPDACKALCRGMFDTIRRHPNIAQLLAGDVRVGPNALAAREYAIAFLLANGFPPALAARSYATLSRYVLGFAIQLDNSVDGLDDARITRVFHELDPSQFPATVAAAEHLPVPFDEEFDFGLELIVDGLAHALQREKRPRRRSSAPRG